MVSWIINCKKAFQKLEELCSKTPILAYADFSKHFKLHTDACGSGLGAVLHQEQDGKGRVINLASHSINKSEQKYPTHKMEFLAVRSIVTECFHKYLYGNMFGVFKDNNLLTHILWIVKLDATSHQWVAIMSKYNFKIFYKTGKLNVDADASSRILWDHV